MRKLEYLKLSNGRPVTGPVTRDRTGVRRQGHQVEEPQNLAISGMDLRNSGECFPMLGAPAGQDRTGEYPGIPGS